MPAESAGQREDVESDVAREDRVRDPERRAVDRRGAPDPRPRWRPGPARRPSTSRHRQAQPPQRRREVQSRRRRPDPEHDRVGHQAPLRGPQVQVEHAGRQPARGQEQQDPGGQLAGEDDLVPDLPEPPPVGDPARRRRAREDAAKDGQQQNRRDAATGHWCSRDRGVEAGSPGVHPGRRPHAGSRSRPRKSRPFGHYPRADPPGIFQSISRAVVSRSSQSRPTVHVYTVSSSRSSRSPNRCRSRIATA